MFGLVVLFKHFPETKLSYGFDSERMGGEEEEQQQLIPLPNFDDQRDEYRFTSVEIPDESIFEGNFFFTAYQRFANEHNHTMGFNVEHFFPKRVDKLLRLKSVPLSDDSKVFEACKTAVKTVLEYLHKKNEHSLLLVRIVKANYRSDSLFFVTFEAKTKAEGEIEEYQSVMFRQLDHDEIVLHMFTKVGAVKGAVQYDCREIYKFETIGKVDKSDFKNRQQFIAYCKYAKEHDVSEGFGIQHFPQKVDGKKTLQRLRRALDETLFEDCKMAVQDVFQYLETNKEHFLVLVRVIKANYRELESSAFGNVDHRFTKTNALNCRQIFLFLVTFEARNKRLGEIKEYQTVILRECSHGKLALHMFRKKRDKRKVWLRTFQDTDAKGVVTHDWRENYYFSPMGLARESEDFDIEHYYDHPVYDGDSTWERCKTSLQNVLKYLESKEECTLKYKKVVKANYNAAYQFFVTFLAEDESGEENEYQSIFYNQHTNGEICLHMFRRKGEDKHNDKVAQPIFDVRDEYEFYPAFSLDFHDSPDYDSNETYAKEHDESEGFDIKTFISHPSKYLLYQGDDNVLEDCKVAVEHVLDYLRSQYEENLKLVEITKANYTSSDDMYFVTFKAKNKVSRQINDYQSVISLNSNRWIDLHMFRKKGDPVHRLNVSELAKLNFPLPPFKSKPYLFECATNNGTARLLFLSPAPVTCSFSHRRRSFVLSLTGTAHLLFVSLAPLFC
ncbi:hypothetical protein M5689_020374 [Euphorbia peplus]|nr:hypothetical protein M5689_020374 [Euphorbia peplus]